MSWLLDQNHFPKQVTGRSLSGEDRIKRIIREYVRSLPFFQFEDQVKELVDRWLFQGSGPSDASAFLPDVNILHLAVATVKKRWVDQGIWDENWRNEGIWFWKHDMMRRWFERANASATRRWIRRRRHNNLGKTVNQFSTSRPINQFLAQVDLERGYLLSRPDRLSYFRYTLGVDLAPDLKEYSRCIAGEYRIDPRSGIGYDYWSRSNVNTIAYEITKRFWEKRGIWDPLAGPLPDLIWAHERQLSTLLEDAHMNVVGMSDATKEQCFEILLDQLGLHITDIRTDHTWIPISPHTQISLDTTRKDLWSLIVDATPVPQLKMDFTDLAMVLPLPGEDNVYINGNVE